ncbi:hypothetical protein [Pontibacterium sp.]|uniref:hypothetical protein n=1 Tax=Pontibacterium sp. TaxID=2036026 RepID=UPI00356A1BF0
MRKNRDCYWDDQWGGEGSKREGVDRLPQRDSASDGVVGRERLYPDHRINRNNNHAPGELCDD